MKLESMQTVTAVKPVDLKHILISTDLSPGARNALLYAAYIARGHGSKLFVVHVIHPEVYPFQLADTWPLMADAEAQMRHEAKQMIERTLQAIPHEMIFQRGSIWKTLSSIIERREIDLLVLGTHGRTGLAKLMMGSVAEEVFRQAACPVLTVGPCVCTTPQTDITPKRILYATDFSVESLAAAPFAVSFARENHAQLILLHCTRRSEDKEALRDSLRDVVPIGSGLTKPPVCMVTGGPHAETILDIASQELVDLIVLGVRSAGWRLLPETHFVNSTAYQVAVQASCPVLTVRA